MSNEVYKISIGKRVNPVIKRVTETELDSFIMLHNHYASEDYYVLKTTKEMFLESRGTSFRSGELQIYISFNRNQLMGYISFFMRGKNASIEELYVIKGYESLEGYKELLEVPSLYVGKGIQVHHCVSKDQEHMMRVMMRCRYSPVKYQVEMEMSLGKGYQHFPRLTNKKFYQVNDIKALNQFMYNVIKPAPNPYTLQEVSNMVVKGDDLKLLFFHEGLPVGFTVGFVNEQRNRQEGRDILYIEEIAIAEKYRSSGFGKEMIREILNRGISHGMKQARLHVYMQNKTAIRLYRSVGFKQTRIIGYWKRQY